MSETEKDSIMESLFERPDMKLRNIKFCRGSGDLISDSDFRAQVHSAIVQARTGVVTGSGEAPKSGRNKVDVREIVANI